MAKKLQMISLKNIENTMDRRLAKYLLLIPLFEIGNSLADLSQDGQSFGGNLLDKQQSTLNEKEASEKLQNLPGYQAYQNGNGTKEEAENSRAIKEMQGTFSANMDRGLKNDDPIKSELTKNNAKKLESATKSNEPSLNLTTELLKQKHRWHINDEDPVFFGSNAVSKSKEKVEKERSEISSVIKKVEGSNAASAIILCREGIKPVNVTCQKRLKLIPIIQGQETKTVTISISEDFPTWYLWGHHGRKVYVDLKTGGIKSSEGNPPNMSIDKPLGSMNNAEKAEVTLSSQKNEHSHANLSIFTLTESPSAGNGFVATFQLYRGFYGFFHNWSKKATYVWKVIIQPKPTLEEHWEGCELEEKRVKENYCTLMAKEQKEKNETKRINGYPDLVTKDFWLEEREYLCGLGSQANECEKLKKEGCEQIASQCVKGEKESCIEYEQTYRCKPKAFQKESDVVIPKIPNEDEIKKAVSDNSQSFGTEDFGEALAEFGALTEMGNQMKDGLGGIKGDPKNPSVFRILFKIKGRYTFINTYRNCSPLTSLRCIANKLIAPHPN
jgi:hypothetical protein